MKNIDLHMHTSSSDGECTPQELIDKSIKSNLSAIAITDHDTISSLKVAIDYAKDKPIEVIPGIEISCYEEERGYDEVHILGLFIDYNNKELIEFTEKIKEDRINQKKRIIKNLQGLGFEIEFKDIEGIMGFSAGRPHIAKTLIKKYPEKFDSIKEVFDKYISIGKPAYSDREFKVRIKDAIDIIKKAKGIAFLAHPGYYNEKDSLELIDIFVSQGGLGIETIYPYDIVFPNNYDKKKTENKISFLIEVAKNKDLMECGGSDFHGKMRYPHIGKIKVDYSILEKIKKILE